MSLFNDIRQGLEQAIDYESGKLSAKTVKLTVAPLVRFTPEEIKYMGVSVKTVEAWEAGRNHPEGAACRLLAMTQSDPAFPQKAGIITAVRAQ